MATAREVARHIEAKHTYGQMQLQKLLYYSQAWSLAWTGKPLFADQIEAWKDGPVVPNVFFGHHGGGTVLTLDGRLEPALTDAQEAIIDAVYAFYGTMGGKALSVLTHREEPWLEARGDLPRGVNSNRPLSSATMRAFYTRQSVLGEDRVPQPPNLRTMAADVDVAAIADQHRSRWRTLLDSLATK